MVAPRTSKYGNNHQLRKIAEGLGDLKIIKIRAGDSRDNSIEGNEDRE